MTSPALTRTLKQTRAGRELRCPLHGTKVIPSQVEAMKGFCFMCGEWWLYNESLIVYKKVGVEF